MYSFAMSRALITSLVFVFSPVLSYAWGPHTEIAQAALDAMGPMDALVLKLGPMRNV